jgi:hypothetical protein
MFWEMAPEPLCGIFKTISSPPRRDKMQFRDVILQSMGKNIT